MVIYGRVSSHYSAGAMDDLECQVNRLREWVVEYRRAVMVESFSDVASGLSDRRPGLRRALHRCQDEDVVELVVTHPERLARFGTGLTTSLLAGHGVTVTVIGEDSDLSGSAEPELVRDIGQGHAGCGHELLRQALRAALGQGPGLDLVRLEGVAG
ncbi:MAG: recombinase family protein [Acidimicrobiales bacterium]